MTPSIGRRHEETAETVAETAAALPELCRFLPLPVICEKVVARQLTGSGRGNRVAAGRTGRARLEVPAPSPSGGRRRSRAIDHSGVTGPAAVLRWSGEVAQYTARRPVLSWIRYTNQAVTSGPCERRAIRPYKRITKQIFQRISPYRPTAET